MKGRYFKLSTNFAKVWLVTAFLTLPSTAALGTSCWKGVKNDGSLFAAKDPVQIELAAPLTDMFQAAYAGVKNKLVPATGRVTNYHQGLLRIDGIDYKVKVKVRGQTSIAKASFPKLTVKIKEAPAGLEPGQKVKIGTHIGEAEGSKAKYQKNRLHNELAPPREAFIYDLMELLKLPAQRAQQAKVTWVDTSSPSPLETITRNAFITEHIKTVAARNGWERGPSEDYVSKEFIASLDRVHSAKIHMFAIMIGKWDFKLPLNFKDNPRKDRVHNVYTLIRPNGQAVPVMHDFDLTALVTGKHYTHRKMPFPKGFSREAVVIDHELKMLQAELTPTEFQAAIQWIQSHQNQIMAAVKTLEVDAYGHEFITKYISTFFAHLKKYQK